MKLMIFDGNSIFNRAFYGIRLLTNSKGQYTNAIYGFLNIFFKFVDEVKPDYVCVAFDLRAKTFRHKMYDGYKAQRKGMPEELAEQMPPLKQILEYMNVKMLSIEGYEADDIIGTVSRICDEDRTECYVVTGDKDDLQLASDNTTIKLVVTRMGNTETTDYSDKTVFEKYGVTPEEFISVKALMGDSSDNIPGVSGIGEKSAFALIQKYKSLDGVYENIEELKGAQKTKIENGKDMAYLSYTLSKIDVNVPIEFKIDDAVVKQPDEQKLVGILDELELKTVISRLGLTEQKKEELYFKHKQVESLAEIPIKDEFFYILNISDELRSISVFSDGTIYDKEFQTNFDVIIENDNIKGIFENPKIKKISHDIKKDIVFLKNNYDISYEGEIFDTKICAYIEQASKNDYLLDEMCREYLNCEVKSEDFAGVLPLLRDKMTDEIEENNQHTLLYDVEFPLVKVLASMETEGFKVDKESLSEFSKVLGARLYELEQDIYELAGQQFNINSPKQLGVILFEVLKLPVVKKTKSGYSTNVEVLEKLEYKHDIIGKIMEYRTVSKLKSTYADGLYSVINPKTQKINSSFNQTITTTGRISSTEPNLQNIPIRTEFGRQIRKMFVASDENRVLIDADYSQIELRVLAHISGDENMINAFKSGADIHTLTASQAFRVPLDEVSPQLRSRAKAVNFGLVYGIGEFSLAKDIGVTRKVAGEYIESYFAAYPGIKEYLEKTVEEAKQNGYASTLLNRRRYIPELKSSNFNLRSFGERVAKNAPIQGYAADIIKIAMVKVYNRIKKEGLKSKLILQVHDELIIDALKEEEVKVSNILKEEMENAVSLSVPLTVELKSGYRWFDTK